MKKRIVIDNMVMMREHAYDKLIHSNPRGDAVFKHHRIYRMETILSYAWTVRMVMYTVKIWAR